MDMKFIDGSRTGKEGRAREQPRDDVGLMKVLRRLILAFNRRSLIIPFSFTNFKAIINIQCTSSPSNDPIIAH